MVLSEALGRIRLYLPPVSSMGYMPQVPTIPELVYLKYSGKPYVNRRVEKHRTRQS